MDFYASASQGGNKWRQSYIMPDIVEKTTGGNGEGMDNVCMGNDYVIYDC